MESLSFDEIHFYDTLKTGITVSVILKFGEESVDFEAKVDTGSSYCIFERKHAERFGQTEAGRYLACYFVYKKDNRALILSARDMTDAERKRYGRK